jgi:hypothetical protein
MKFFDYKHLGNHLLQLCPKVVKHPVYKAFRPALRPIWPPMQRVPRAVSSKVERPKPETAHLRQKVPRLHTVREYMFPLSHISY